MRNPEWALTRNITDEISFASRRKERFGRDKSFYDAIISAKMSSRFFSYMYKYINNFSRFHKKEREFIKWKKILIQKKDNVVLSERKESSEKFRPEYQMKGFQSQSLHFPIITCD